VLLSGALDDGTAGLLAIKQRGGAAVVQDPNEALFPGMPRSALENVAVDYRLLLAEIGPLLARLALEPAAEEERFPVPAEMEQETDIVTLEMGALRGDDHSGTSSVYSCPECGGVLWELEENGLLRFRCRVGHAFSAESVLAEQADQLEAALWTALKTLEERVSLSERLRDRAHARNQPALAQRFDEKLRDDQQRAGLIRQVLLKDEVE
jgi:two-component system chemotaxis response regulator CheB